MINEEDRLLTAKDLQKIFHIGKNRALNVRKRAQNEHMVQEYSKPDRTSE